MVTTLTYATTSQLADVLGIKKSIPSWDVGSSPSNEEVGTGDSSTSIFYLDHQNILANSYTLYYGSAATTTTTLTETTHYVLDKSSGKITLTAAGITLLSTNKIFAKYSYCSNDMSDSYLETVLIRAQKEVDGKVSSTFTDGSLTNPSYPVEDEITASEGIFMNRVIAKKKPLIDISSSIDGDLSAVAVTIPLTTGTGSKFPSSGYAIIGSEVISYTGISTDSLTGVTRGVLGTTASTHTDLDAIHTTIFFKSDSFEGSPVVWNVQPWDTSMYANELGLVYSFKDVYPYNVNQSLVTPGVENRVRLIYRYGYDSIPEDITRLTLLLAKRQLIQDNISKALVAGRDEFQPEMFNVDMEEIESIVRDYKIVKMGNT